MTEQEKLLSQIFDIIPSEFKGSVIDAKFNGNDANPAWILKNVVNNSYWFIDNGDIKIIEISREERGWNYPVVTEAALKHILVSNPTHLFGTLYKWEDDIKKMVEWNFDGEIIKNSMNAYNKAIKLKSEYLLLTNQ